MYYCDNCGWRGIEEELIEGCCPKCDTPLLVVTSAPHPVLMESFSL